MVKNGSSASSEKLAAYLSLAGQFHVDTETLSIDRKRYSKALLAASRQFDLALKEGDFDKILDLEKSAQKFDLIFSKAVTSNDLRIQSLTGLYDAGRYWKEGKNPELVRRRFGGALEGVKGITLGDRQLKDTVMEGFVRTHCRRLGVFAGGTANPAESFFYTKRQECLRALQKEHQKNLDKALGIASKSRGLTR